MEKILPCMRFVIGVRAGPRVGRGSLRSSPPKRIKQATVLLAGTPGALDRVLRGCRWWCGEVPGCGTVVQH